MAKERFVELRQQKIRVIDSSLLPLALCRQEEKRNQKGKISRVFEIFRRRR